MKGRWNQYLPEELAWIEAHKDWPRDQLHQGFCARFGRQDVAIGAFKGLCKRKGWMTGRTGCFVAGQVAHIAGKRLAAHPNSMKTRFQKGQLPHNTNHIGHERLTVDGYVVISVAEPNPYTPADRRYIQKHLWLWQKLHGPVPKGQCLKCLDGNKVNTDPANWEAIPRAMLPRLNGKFGRGYDAAAPETKPVIMAVTKLEHRARELRKGAV